MMCVLAVGARAGQYQGNGPDDVLQYMPYAAVFALKAGGVESRSDWTQMASTAAVSFVASAAVVYTLKHTVREWRPDNSDRNSFPSGHSAFALAGATMLHHEYGHVSPWISIGGYAVATLTAVDRVCRDRHYWYDAAAGAGIGILSAKLGYYVTDRLFPRHNVSLALTGCGIDVAVRW